MARPTKYQEAYAEQARKLCLGTQQEHGMF